MFVTEYDVGAGAYGVTIGTDGAVWTTLVERGELARVSLAGQVSRLHLDAEQSRPMVLATGPGSDVTTYPLPAAGAAPVGIHGGRDAVWFTEIGAGQIGRIFPDGRIEQFPLPDRSCRPHAVAAASDGGCWATLWASSSVVRLDCDGRVIEEVTFRPGAEPHGLAIAADGSLWVALEAGSLAPHQPTRPPVGRSPGGSSTCLSGPSAQSDPIERHLNAS